MFTVCPKCALRLMVTAADLRVAQGNVRCGRCLNVFNALDSISESHPSEASPRHDADDYVNTAPPLRDAADYVDDVSPPRNADDYAQCPPPPDDADDYVEAVPPLRDAADYADGAPSPRDAADYAEDAPPPRDADDYTDADPSESAGHPPSEAPSRSATWRIPPTAAEVSLSTSALDADGAQPLADAVIEVYPISPEPCGAESPHDEPSRPNDEGFELETDRPRGTLGWSLGAAALSVLLVLQIVNHYRGTLVTLPSVGAPLRAAYARLGIRVSPLWNVRAYDARQLGATVSGTNPYQITVRASIANRGQRSLPLPLLRVTLQDSFGRPIAARDVKPRSYLPPSASPQARLAPGGRVDAAVVFVSPGPQAVGFEIDACLPEAGTVVCAHGP